MQAEQRRLRQQADALLDTATLRRLRLQAGYSTRRFARALGVSASTVRSLEEGSNHDQLPLTLLACLAELLGVTPQELFAGLRPSMWVVGTLVLGLSGGFAR